MQTFELQKKRSTNKQTTKKEKERKKKKNSQILCLNLEKYVKKSKIEINVSHKAVVKAAESII